MAPIDVLEAEAEVAAREETVILAEEQIRITEDILKRLINDPESTDFWTERLRAHRFTRGLRGPNRSRRGGSGRALAPADPRAVAGRARNENV